MTKYKEKVGTRPLSDLSFMIDGFMYSFLVSLSVDLKAFIVEIKRCVQYSLEGTVGVGA